MNVLVVDDETISRRTTAHLLRESGFGVTTARDGEEALVFLKEHAHQIVVADWQMPGMDGLKLCRSIRAGDLRQYVYFLMLTSRDRLGDKVTGFETGVDDYIAKPFHPRVLLLRVKVGQRIVEQAHNQATILALPNLAEKMALPFYDHLDVVV